MQLICTQENFSKALSHLERVVGKQMTLPILSNFLLETENGRLKISATNLEIGVIVYIGAKIKKEGRITIPAKVLSNFVSQLPSGDVLSLESDGIGLKVESAVYKIRIKGLDGKDFPLIPQYVDDYFFSFPAQTLKNALTRVLFCVSLNDARLELTGAHIFFYKDQIHLAATDSFRLAEEIIPFTEYGSGYKDFLEKNPSLIIPRNTLSEIMRVINPESSEVKIALRDNQIFFEIDGVQIISRIINGKYPDYKQIIPKSFSSHFILERESFQRAIKIAHNFSSYASGEITLFFDGEKKECIVSSVSQEIGENKAILTLEPLQGTGIVTLSINPRYILDGINAFGGEKIVFLVNDGISPVGIRLYDEKEAEKEEKNYLYIIMPIRK
ncbi:MAG: DNA polymerase III subunit beta [Minisyncoccota bacterium]